MFENAGGTHRARLIIILLYLVKLMLVRAHDGDYESSSHHNEIGFVASTGGGMDAQQQHQQTVALSSTENPPHFAHSIYNVSIAENSVGKTYAIQPPNEDRLGISVSAPDLDIKFRIVGGDKDKLFKAEERIVGDFAFLAIRTRTGNVILNREKIDEYRLDVRATITRRDSKTNVVVETDTTVIVRVMDTNDLSPLFYPNEYTVAVAEDMPLHKSIIKVIAEDADLGINGEIYYSFLEGSDYFAVHPTSGVITLTRPLKFTDRSIHELVVVATDRGSTNNNRLSQASKARVHVKVKQVSLI